MLITSIDLIEPSKGNEIVKKLIKSLIEYNV